MGALSDREYINEWVIAAFKTPVLLGGYWDDYPELEKAYVAYNVTQATVGLAFFIFVLTYSFQKNLLDTNWTIKLLPNQFNLSWSVIVPLLMCAWEMILAGMQIAIVYAWFSAPSMSMVYIHSQIEWFLVLVRTTMLWHTQGCCSNKVMQVATLLSIFGTTITLLAFTTTSNPHIQGILAAISFITDFILFFAAPTLGFYIWTHKRELGSPLAVRSEILVTVLCLIHIFEFYPPIFMVVSQNTFDMRRTAGNWLCAWGYINLVFFIVYMYCGIKGLKDYVAQQGEHQQLINDQQE